MINVRMYAQGKATKGQTLTRSGLASGTGGGAAQAANADLTPYLRITDAAATYVTKPALDDMFTKICLQEGRDEVKDASGNVTQAAIAAKYAIRANYDLFSVGGVSAYGQGNGGAGSGTGTGTGGVTTFAALQEVAALTPADGQVWGYKDGAYTWLAMQGVPTSHTHTIADITGLQAALDAKAAAAHTHTAAQVTGLPTALKNPAALTIQANGTTLAAYDGSTAKTANITPGGIGAATASHTHTQYALTSHTHTIANITGLQSALDAKAAASHTHSYLPLSGGELTGDLWLHTGSSNYGACLYFGDKDYVHIKEVSDDHLEIKATGTNILGTLTVNNAEVSLEGHTHPFSAITSKPTTLAGYGITDAYTKAEVNGKQLDLWGNIVSLGQGTGVKLSDIHLPFNKEIYYYLNGSDHKLFTPNINTGDIIINYNNANNLRLQGTEIILGGNSADYMTASIKGLKIGSAYLRYDSANNALVLDDGSGGAVNFLSKGGVSAYA